MLKQITKNIIQFSFSIFGSNVYLLKKEKLLVDTSSKENMKEFLNDLEKLKIKPEEIKVILLTHCHYDHVGNLSLFARAKIYASEKELAFLPAEIKKRAFSLSKFKLPGFEVIETPGHTRGSVAFYLEKEKILFSGDTIFDKDAFAIGRTDLPTSQPEKIQESIDKLKKLNYKTLCPGH